MRNTRLKLIVEFSDLLAAFKLVLLIIKLSFIQFI